MPYKIFRSSKLCRNFETLIIASHIMYTLLSGAEDAEDSKVDRRVNV